MKFVTSSSELLKGLMSVSKAIPAKTNEAILENYLFVLGNNSLEVTASDKEITMKTSITVETSGAEDEGRIAVPARQLNDLLKELPDQPLTIRTISDNQFECIWSSGSSTLPFFNPDDYPECKSVEEGFKTVVFTGASLVDGISKTIYASSDEDNRPVMNCSEATAAEVDAEVMKVLKESYDEAKRLLTEHRKALDKIAAFLIEKETITGKEFMQIFHEVEGITETDHKEPEARIRQRPTEETSAEEVSVETQPEAGDVIALPPTSETDIAQPKTEEAAGDMPEEAPTAEEVQKDTAKDEVHDNGSETVQPATDEAAGTSLEEKTDRL